jgi:hypothetical protein
MTDIIKFAMALMVCGLATTAQADDARASLLRCGIKLGGSSEVQLTFSGASKIRKRGQHQAVKASAHEDLAPRAFTDAISKPTRRQRTPPTFTLAKFECSWR